MVPWIYTGGLENHPKLIAKMAAIRPLWGNGPEALRLGRDPFAVQAILRDAGLPSLQVRSDRSKLSAGCRWLRKPRKGSAGQGITFQGPGPRGRSSTHFYQQFVEGTPMSAVFVRARGTVTLLGVTEQLIGIDWLNASPFRYCGNIGPADLAESMRSELLRIGRALGDGCGLLGLFGVDFIAKEGRPWVVEVNPRFPASVEVLEMATGMAVLSFHRQAFDAAARPLPIAGSTRGCVGKAILYAPRRLVMPPTGVPRGTLIAETSSKQAQTSAKWAIADIPTAGETVEKGWPILTILARDQSHDGCLALLQRTAQAILRTL
jgi:predicted ATP-grasp superfamily ATP-dependent carboligase